MTFEQLRGYPPGLVVTVFCCTSAANIGYKGGTDGIRARSRPSDYQIRATRFTQTGRFLRLVAGKIAYFEIEVEADVADIQDSKVVGYMPGKKVCSIPISAICRKPKIN